MVDFHTHILPHFDDGAADTSTALAMIHAIKDMGVTAIVSTSHYYAEHEEPEHFLSRRKQAFDHLKERLDEDIEIRLAAEVAYFEGMSQVAQLRDMCMEGTNVLLVELPFRAIGDNVYKELKKLEYQQKVRVMLVHLDRYSGLYDMDELCQYDFLVQLNASSFQNFFKCHKMKSFIDRGIAHVLGSDCHNLDARKPNLDQAYARLSPQQRKKISQNEKWILNMKGWI